jgi:alpha-galactosidase
MTVTDLKIAYVGGGSREWARKLMFDLALCPDLSGSVALYDIDLEAARLNARLGNWLQDQPGVVSRWRYEAVTALAAALQGADFVVLSIQPGRLETMAEEIAIAESYGLYFPVGDTTGAPGLVRGLRSATIYAGFAQAIAAACPQAWVINYTNPMTICTRTLSRVAPGLRVFGCCHEVFSSQRMLARVAQARLNLEAAPPRESIHVNVLGVNHFTWIDRAEYEGHDLLALLREHLAEPGVLRPYTRQEVEGFNNWFHSTDQVKFTLFLRYGILAAAGDRHLVEFVPGFVHSPDILFRWGIIRTPVAWRIERWTKAAQHTAAVLAGEAPLELAPTGEEGVNQMRALLGLGDVVTNVNLENTGQIADLPLGAVVETNARFTRGELRPVQAGSLPPGVHPMVARHVANQEMIVAAALTRDRDLAFQAIYADPTNRLALDDTWKMYNEMLYASREWLPGWKLSG